jgi:hypothetical protein
MKESFGEEFGIRWKVEGEMFKLGWWLGRRRFYIIF